MLVSKAFYNIVLSDQSKGKLCIEFTQENLLEFLNTSCLSYIHLATSLCYTNLVYPKEIYNPSGTFYNILYFMQLCDYDL